VAFAPLGHAGVPLPLIHHVGKIHLPQRDDAHAGHLDDRDRTIVRVDDHQTAPDFRQGLSVMLVVGDECCRGGLGTVEDRCDELVAQWAREGELDPGHRRDVCG
jgi:hypothetical protein